MEFTSAKQQEFVERFEQNSGKTVLFEDVSARTLRSKTLATGSNERTLVAGVVDTHYKEADGSLCDIDPTLVATPDGWEMKKAGYNVAIKKIIDTDSPFTFTNNKKDYGLIPRSLSWDTGIELSSLFPVSGKQVDNLVEYANAFGVGRHLQLEPMNIGFRKIVKFDSLDSFGSPAIGATACEAWFEIVVPEGTDIWYEDLINNVALIESIRKQLSSLDKERIRLEKEVGDDAGARAIHTQQMFLEEDLHMAMKSKWDKTTDQRFQGRFIIQYADGTKTYSYAPKIWEASGKGRLISCDLRARDGKLYLVKILPWQFLESALFPVFTDTVTNYNSGAGDGYVGRSGSAGQSFATVRGDADGNDTNYTGSTGQYFVESFYNGGSNVYGLYRGFLPIDTSGLGASAVITAATLNIYADGKGTAYATTINIVQTTQASNTVLANADFDQVGSTVSVSGNISSVTTSSYNSFSLDATGLTWVSKTGFTKLGGRTGSDVNNTSPTGNDANVTIRMSEAGTNTPYLAVTYTVPARARIIIT